MNGNGRDIPLEERRALAKRRSLLRIASLPEYYLGVIGLE